MHGFEDTTPVGAHDYKREHSLVGGNLARSVAGFFCARPQAGIFAGAGARSALGVKHRKPSARLPHGD